MNQDDGEASAPSRTEFVRVKWEVPLPWLISGAIFLAGQAAVVYFGQVRQGELITEQSVMIKDLTRQFRDLNTLISSNNLKDVQHDMMLADLVRRVHNIETTQLSRRN